jgi:hypothetical protein
MDANGNHKIMRMLFLMTARSYRNAAFLNAAEHLGIEVVQAVDMPKELSQSWSNGFGVDFMNIDESVSTIKDYHAVHPLRAILPVDDSGSALAASAGEALGLPHNSQKAASATRDKLIFRRSLQGSRLNTPRFEEYITSEDISPLITKIGFPCVVKPRSLNGSRGVIRADNREELDAAISRTARLVRSIRGQSQDTAVSILVESYIPGKEVAVEGILDGGCLEILALFDKPDPLEGPFFEETIYVTPSRLPEELQDEIARTTARAAKVIGLTTGPVHAELRFNNEGVWIVEIAGRSIGGLCSQTLQFGAGGSLEEIILRQACGLNFSSLQRSDEARGVMMIPIPGAGLLRGVDGIDQAKNTPLIENVEITAPLNNTVTPLPEGDGYLGFIFSRGNSPQGVEEALRLAHQKLTFKIDILLPVLQGNMGDYSR